MENTESTIKELITLLEQGMELSSIHLSVNDCSQVIKMARTDTLGRVMMDPEKKRKDEELLAYIENATYGTGIDLTAEECFRVSLLICSKERESEGESSEAFWIIGIKPDRVLNRDFRRWNKTEDSKTE